MNIDWLDPALLPFSIALSVMVILAVIEIASALVGMALSGLVDGLLPEFDVPDVDAPDVGMDAPSIGPVGQFFGWLCVGKVPTLVLLILFLTAFGLSGLLLQQAAMNLAGGYWPGSLAAAAAVFAALPCTRFLAQIVARVLPKEETEAVSTESFIGEIATIIRGTAKKGMPAEAKLQDGFGQTHYVLVEPEDENLELTAGDRALLKRQRGTVFEAAVPPSAL